MRLLDLATQPQSPAPMAAAPGSAAATFGDLLKTMRDASKFRDQFDAMLGVDVDEDDQGDEDGPSFGSPEEMLMAYMMQKHGGGMMGMGMPGMGMPQPPQAPPQAPAAPGFARGPDGVWRPTGAPQQPQATGPAYPAPPTPAPAPAAPTAAGVMQAFGQLDPGEQAQLVHGLLQSVPPQYLQTLADHAARSQGAPAPAHQPPHTPPQAAPAQPAPVEPEPEPEPAPSNVATFPVRPLDNPPPWHDGYTGDPED